ncbi:MAG: DUF58 domain-containing protein [Deltaproteobacteria bacterium]|nr:DUF58 domain-containing protein [Deltaproteobacteria bacterium]
MDLRLGAAAGGPGGGEPLGPAAAARAARLLWVRSRREATSWLVGGYASAFRGGGVEFEELRPYTPGDDVRAIDWNATARSGEPWVKRFREERAHTVLVLLDVSASMAFGSGQAKLASAAYAAALVAAAAGRAGDRVGLALFSDSLRSALPPARGALHGWRLVRSIARESLRAGGATELGLAAGWALGAARRRALVVLLSDFRDPALARAVASGGSSPLAALAERHELVSIVVEDPRERALAAAGTLRLVDPERGGAPRVLGTGARRRARYAAVAEARRVALRHRLRSEGADVLALSTAEDPLRALARFFRTRVDRRRRAWR